MRAVLRPGRAAARRLRMVTDYLQEHLADNVGLLELANIAQLSRSHFCRAFRVSTGLSPHQWLVMARIQKAKELLVSVKLPIADIAVLTGFSRPGPSESAFQPDRRFEPRRVAPPGGLLGRIVQSKLFADCKSCPFRATLWSPFSGRGPKEKSGP